MISCLFRRCLLVILISLAALYPADAPLSGENSPVIESILSRRYDPSGVEDIVDYCRLLEQVRTGAYAEAEQAAAKWRQDHSNSVLMAKVSNLRILVDYHRKEWNDLLKDGISSVDGLYLYDYLAEEGQTNRSVSLAEYLIRKYSYNDDLEVLIPDLEEYYRGTNEAELPYPWLNDLPLAYNYARLLYRKAEYDRAWHLFEKIKKRKVPSDVEYYRGVIQYRRGKYKEAETILKPFLTANPGFSRDKSKPAYWARYYLVRSLEKQNKNKEAYDILDAFLKKNIVELYYRTMLRISRKCCPSEAEKIKSGYLKRFPDTYTAYKTQKDEAFADIRDNKKIERGLKKLKKAYRYRKGDYRFIESLLTGKKREEVFLQNDNAFFDEFYYTTNYGLLFPELQPVISNIDIHNENVLLRVREKGRIIQFSNLVKPLYVEAEDLKREYAVSTDDFFSNYYLAPESFKQSNYFRRLKLLLALDLKPLALKEIKMVFKKDEYLRYSYLTFAHELTGRPTGSLRATMRLLNRRKRPDLLPWDFLRKAYPLYQDEKVQYLCRKYKIDRAFVYAIMREESHFKDDAVSWAGASGLMQIMNATGRDIYRKSSIRHQFKFNLFDPDVNLHLGISHLAWLMKLYDGNMIYSAAAYNAGQGNVRKWRKKKYDSLAHFALYIPYDETEKYVQKVLRSWRYYRLLYSWD